MRSKRSSFKNQPIPYKIKAPRSAPIVEAITVPTTVIWEWCVANPAKDKMTSEGIGGKTFLMAIKKTDGHVAKLVN